MNTGLERIPALAEAEIRQLFVGPESFTPDNRYILGEAPDLRRLYVAAGFNSIGIQSAGGAGKALAEWIVEDAPTMDLAELDIRRFHRFERNRAYLFDRTKEPSDFCTLCIGRSVNQRLAAAHGVVRSTTALRRAAPALV